MDSVLDQIGEWLKELLVSGIMNQLTGLFDSVNTQVGDIATQVGTTPANFSPGVFAMIRNVSESVIIPVAGLILTFIACYELIQMIIDHNNLANFETWIFFKWVFKTFVAVTLITNTFNIVMAVFDVTQHVINNAGGLIAGNTAVDAAALETMQDTLEAMEIGPLFALFLQCMVVQFTIKALSVVIFVIVYGLLQQEEKEAHRVATALEIYVKGSLNLFNHRTNVDIRNRFVCYDIKELGKQLKKLGMLIVQDQVWGRVTANRSAGKTTRYYMDEFHLLLKEEQTASYSVEIWKRFRKWGGIPTGITQNVKDLLSSREVENIFENSDFVYMLNQAAGDRQILAQQLNISPHQLSYVTHSGEGEGLLFYGNVILPFVDHFPTDLELYRIMTTKLSEVAEAKAV